MGHQLRGAGDLIPAAIVDRDGQVDHIIVLGQLLKFIHQLLQLFIQLEPIANKTHANALGLQSLGFAFDILPEQRHQPGDFGLCTLPVFGRKREYRQIFNIKILAGSHDLFDPARACMMSEQSRAALGLSPATIAIHNDGHVIGRVWNRSVFGHNALPVIRLA